MEKCTNKNFSKNFVNFPEAHILCGLQTVSKCGIYCPSLKGGGVGYRSTPLIPVGQGLMPSRDLIISQERKWMSAGSVFLSGSHVSANVKTTAKSDTPKRTQGAASCNAPYRVRAFSTSERLNPCCCRMSVSPAWPRE